jgi:hypothetical protein
MCFHTVFTGLRPTPAPAIALETVAYDSSAEATTRSWDHKFSGTSHELLREFMVKAMRYQNNSARYSAIVQSSGTGKSRMTDELAKTTFTIPMNLRDPDANGMFPSLSDSG